MRIAVYPGSFDPITKGHLDIIERSAKVFDKLIVAVLINPDKKGLFNIEERVELIEKVTNHLDNIEVDSFNGLLVNYMVENKAQVIIKGLRAVSDFEYEFQMALVNKKLNQDIETLCMMTSAKYAYLSSSSLKQVAMFGGCINDLVPEEIIDDIKMKLKK
ncbi:phosphopantetheine adenylyltransferase [Clostridium homopropionicum DSM 5847]|uniref:Phosphopantetheine adenylyltransferase n=1 Tax=Clostridium homopropionicum DSM 5847 TaxID=1121318 RepID=A0A0L6ZC55_9CLOT|nr:pantetheine-phosphate adenylyltransferase [Clostridium homopropionicum]KOA20537.1 phosphopantetheine adenylyltransferase [Clostridium homopropionicum DSM 5847]SFG38019.1 Phosphopantetheine adenylyltransferase [Clostridium homopropionicum]